MSSPILFLKSNVAGYTRADGTVVRPHQDKRTKKPSKVFGSVAGMAKRAHEGLSPAARSAVESWNVNWTTGALERAYQADNDVAREIAAAFKPVREKLRSIYGDTVPMYRGEAANGDDSGADRKLFSWSPLFDLAQKFAVNERRGIPTPIKDEDIERVVDQYNRTGFAKFGGKKFMRNKDAPEYFNIYDRHNSMITDGDDLRELLRGDQNWRAERIAEIKARGHVYQAEVPVDSLVWIPTGVNLHEPEIIATHNPRTNPATLMAKSIIFLKARDPRDTGTADMFGTHLETRTRKDGVTQQYHVAAPAPAALAPIAEGIPDGHSKRFYVTLIRDPGPRQRVARLAGPFDQHEEALAHVDRARDMAIDVDPRAHFDAFGTAGITAAEHRPGVLNERLGVGKAQHVTETSAFKRWFGDSKVVNERGEPLVVYHGTLTNFSSFDNGKADDQGGFHFGSAAAASDRLESLGNGDQEYDRPEGGDNIMPVYLAIKNPMRVSDFGNDVMRWRKAAERANAAGYDGLVYANDYEDAGTDSFVAFHPEQIKSATGNSGAFDRSSPVITKSILFIRP